MYSPNYAIETDKKKINEVILKHPFATIVYTVENIPQSFHLPLMLEKESLIGHMAKANPAWKDLENKTALIIFHGPHCYISPVWFGNSHNVPTWNYISVHVRGKVKIHHDEPFLRQALENLGNDYDPKFDISLNIDQNSKRLASIVGIEICIDEISAKFKLSQNRSPEERSNVIKVLAQSPSSAERAVAQAMQDTLQP